MIPEFFDQNVIVYQRDGVDFINLLHDDSVQLIWTAPPGTGTPSEKNLTHMEAVELCAAIADTASRVLTSSGVLALSIAHANTKGVVAAISKRTLLHFGGYVIDSNSPDHTVVVFHKGDPLFNDIEHEEGFDSPLSMITRFIEMNTEVGDVVVDPFCGYGNVMEAAVMLDRIAMVNDQDPVAVETTIDRYKERCVQ